MSGHVDVLSAGLQTTVQDLGRWGHQAIGVPVAGPMDPFAHRRANALIANDRDAAVLEVTLTGPTLRFPDARRCAVAGANFELFVDEAPVSCEGVLDLRAGAVLRFGARRAGARAYVAVEGGFDVPMVLGSRATHLPSGMGGWRGRALRRGDRVPLGAAATSAPRTAAWTGPDADSSSKIVRILPGPQDDRFSGAAMEALVSGPYRVDLDSNRMGYRLSGARLEHRGTADIISDATPLGTIQVPSSGQPMLLMADRQTTGGYAKLATVIAADLGIVGQAAPGDFLRFRTCSRAEALTALVARERALLALESIAS